jgi:hypothetical protein
MTRPFDPQTILIAGIFSFILFIVFMVFSPCLMNGFVQWDDPVYLTANPLVRDLSWAHLKQMFTSYVNGNYHPLTTLSYALEYHFFHYDPWIYHLTNIILHMLNTALVYILIKGISKNRFTAFGVMLLFAIHPTRVESVAWVTERKDVLFVLFYLSALIQYGIYLGTHRKRSYWACFVLFLLSLLAKPSAVSLPLVLLLIDYLQKRRFCRSQLLEKGLFFLVSILFGLIAIYGAAHIPVQEHYPHYPEFAFVPRIFLSSAALCLYAGKSIMPLKLSAFYPFPASSSGGLPLLYYLSGIIYVIIGWLLLRLRRNNRLFFFGIAFFLATMVFNLHYYLVGRVLIADRFTYLPYVGLFLIIVEMLRRVYHAHRSWFAQRKIVFLSLLTMAVFLLGYHTFDRCGTWGNDITLWTDVIAKYPKEPLAYYNRGDALARQREFAAAIKDYTHALRLDPAYPRAYCQRGNLFLMSGQYASAVADYNRALAYAPDYIEAYWNKAAYYQLMENYTASLEIYDKILTIAPHHPEALKRKKQIEEILKNKDTE